jgi:hypothetical protein
MGEARRRKALKEVRRWHEERKAAEYEKDGVTYAPGVGWVPNDRDMQLFFELEELPE